MQVPVSCAAEPRHAIGGQVISLIVQRIVLAARIWWGGRPHRGRGLERIGRAWRLSARYFSALSDGGKP